MNYTRFFIITLFILLVHGASAQFVSRDAAIRDLQILKSALQKGSLVFSNESVSLDLAIRKIKEKIKDSITVHQLGVHLLEMLQLRGDHQAEILLKEQPLEKHIPFLIAPYKDSLILALDFEAIRRKGYKPLVNDTFLYLKAIEDKAVQDWIRLSNPFYQMEVTPTSFVKGVNELDLIERQFYKLNQPLPDSLAFTFSNGKLDTTFNLKLLYRNNLWYDRCENQAYLQTVYVRKQYDLLFKVIDDRVAYCFFPTMFDVAEHPDFYQQLDRKMRSFISKEALVIDLRSNNSQNMDLFEQVLDYLIPNNQLPFMFGIESILKTATDIDTAFSSAFVYSEKSLSDQDRGRANQFMEAIPKESRLPLSQFNQQYFIYKRDTSKQKELVFEGPIYILVNEKTAGAASLLAASLKPLPNVTVVGNPTHGYGYSKTRVNLEASQLTVQFSSGVFFQKDGKKLSDQGVQPGLTLARDMEQILGRKDSQLEALMWLIE